jgi:hypothetical protein
MTILLEITARCPALESVGAGYHFQTQMLILSEHFMEEAMVKFSCPPRDQLMGPTNATFRENSNWLPQPPTCEGAAVVCYALKNCKPNLFSPSDQMPRVPAALKRPDSAGSHFVGDTVL